MEQPAQKSGLPRGCFIALIVGGILIVLLVALMGVCYFNKDKVFKWTIRTGVVYAQQALAKDPAGIDTVKFNALANEFIVQLDAGEITDEQFTAIGPIFQGTMADKQIDASDVYKLSDAMVTLFPSLEPLKMIPGKSEEMVTDSTLPNGTDTIALPAETLTDSSDGD
ncbi:MAG: hypothetical protein IPH75_15495 [bacterium]|nr:hypothetical protein [bacterium]